LPDNNPQRLGDLLLEANLIDEIQLRVALQEQATTGERLGSALVHLGFIDEAVLAAFLSKQADLPCVNIHGLHIPPEIVALIPKAIAFENAIIPIRRSGNTLYLAMADPFDQEALDIAADVTGLEVMPLIAPEFRLKKSLERFYEEEVYDEPMERVSLELSGIAEEIEKDSIEGVSSRVDQLSAKIDALRAAVELLRAAVETGKR
jgi:type IV pilus assembly protein PilB